MSRTLGIDYGTVRIGLAMSDAVGVVAMTHSQMTVKSRKEAVAGAVDLIQRESVERVVVGLPLNMDGTDSEMTRQVRNFTEMLKELVDCPVLLWDERMSSKQVERALIEGDVSRSKRKESRDMMAAQIMLQSYLESQSPMDMFDADDWPMDPQ